MTQEKTDSIDNIKSKFKSKMKIQNERRIWLTIEPEKLVETCKWLKEKSFEHLSAISVTDWLDKGKYELTYHLWSYEKKILITVKTKINREKPVIESVNTIWYENAQIHERELHELFGVKFKGNKDLLPLFLENWKGKDPFRKDFNWRDYVRNEFYDKKDEREQVYYDQ